MRQDQRLHAPADPAAAARPHRSSSHREERSARSAIARAPAPNGRTHSNATINAASIRRATRHDSRRPGISDRVEPRHTVNSPRGTVTGDSKCDGIIQVRQQVARSGRGPPEAHRVGAIAHCRTRPPRVGAVSYSTWRCTRDHGQADKRIRSGGRRSWMRPSGGGWRQPNLFLATVRRQCAAAQRQPDIAVDAAARSRKSDLILQIDAAWADGE